MLKVIAAVGVCRFWYCLAVQVPVLRWGSHRPGDCDDNPLHSQEVRRPRVGRLLCGVPHQTPPSGQRIHAPDPGSLRARGLPDSTALFVDELLISPGCVLILGQVIWWTSTCQSLLGHHRQKHCRCNKRRRLYRHRLRSVSCRRLIVHFCCRWIKNPSFPFRV